jgi:hypothetical protein
MSLRVKITMGAGYKSTGFSVKFSAGEGKDNEAHPNPKSQIQLFSMLKI